MVSMDRRGLISELGDTFQLLGGTSKQRYSWVRRYWSTAKNSWTYFKLLGFRGCHIFFLPPPFFVFFFSESLPRFGALLLAPSFLEPPSTSSVIPSAHVQFIPTICCTWTKILARSMGARLTEIPPKVAPSSSSAS